MLGPSLRMRKKSEYPPGVSMLYCVGNVRDLIWQCNLITD